MATLTRHSRTEDFAAWAEQTADLLEEHRIDELDLADLIDEVRCLARSELQAVRNQLQRLLVHLLKWAYQPSKRSPSWEVSILDARNKIEDRLDDSPSLRSRLHPELEHIWTRACKRAALETGISVSDFPEHCPWDIDKQILDEDWLP